MAHVLAFLADTLARWGAMMQRPLHEPVPPPPPPRDFTAMIDDEVEEARRRADARAAEPLLPSTDYRTNPRPVQVPIDQGWECTVAMPPGSPWQTPPTLDALRAGLLARGSRGDALRAAVVRAVVKDI